MAEKRQWEPVEVLWDNDWYEELDRAAKRFDWSEPPSHFRPADVQSHLDDVWRPKRRRAKRRRANQDWYDELTDE